jgi:hypothetical protein
MATLFTLNKSFDGWTSVSADGGYIADISPDGIFLAHIQPRYWPAGITEKAIMTEWSKLTNAQ